MLDFDPSEVAEVTYSFRLVDENNKRIAGFMSGPNIDKIIDDLHRKYYNCRSIYLSYQYSLDSEGDKLD